MKRKKNRITFFDIINVFLMLGTFVLVVYPFYYIFIYSISQAQYVTGGLLLLPKGTINLSSYVAIFTKSDILHAIFISVSRTVITSVSMIFITSMAAYALSVEDMPGVKFFRKLFLFTMYFSGGIIPVYLLFKAIHLTGNFLVYVIPYLVNVFNLILVRTYIEEGQSKSLQESAVIDGANDLVIFFKIVFPLITPVLAAILFFESINQWNSFMDTQLYNSMEPNLFTLQYVLYNFLAVQSYSLQDAQRFGAAQANINVQTLKMAITFVCFFPIFAVYPLIQKHFVSGLMIGAIKA
jgi:putative aldouronate transport system permease protein